MAGKSKSEFCFVYVTARDREEALDLAYRTVGSGLAACANLLGAMESVYAWKGEIRLEGEFALILKTRTSLFSRLAAEIRAAHSYECPCIVALPIMAGDAGFLDWIAAQTADPAGES